MDYSKDLIIVRAFSQINSIYSDDLVDTLRT